MSENSSEIRVMSRGEFLKAAGLLVAGAAFLTSTPLLVGCGFPTAPEIDAHAYSIEGDRAVVILEKVPELSRVGGSASIANVQQLRPIIARTGEKKYAVAVNRCTHRQKGLGYDHEAGLFICASGKSQFGLDGAVVRGPAEERLRMYDWHLEGGNLIIELAR